MRSEQAGDAAKAAAGKEAKRVARIRRLRRQAARRRAIIALSLLALTVVVAIAALAFRFSLLFALIPFALLVAVLALGARASSHAREWERQLKLRRHSRAMAAARRGVAAAKRVGQLEAAAQSAQSVDASADAPAARDEDDEPTGVMEQREIRQALRASRADHRRVEAMRAEREHARADAKVESQPVAKAGKPQAASAVKKTTANRSVSKTNASKPASGSKTAESAKAAKPTSQAKAVARVEHEASDATHELKQVHPVPALDVVDMVSNQDLISFSLGAPRSGVEVRAEEPQSLEIKSTKQVAKAVPQDADTSETASASAKADDTAGKGRSSKAAGKAAEVESFHESEVSADVEAPSGTSDSLGVGLEKILARRGA
ncbi:hypothetical protein PT282_01820 [Bifidobacterium sp. ESL0763]|uniref:hypothetical protein n=1 Tax=Bifidobacterium sp. ESL0763 TaxID=2983227 RepID=UPI0023F6D967|nr:hypothetical protein [Bifidobacterium sp. ESL0763]MDF7663420.1 hypothetical protein [Bifidobacterium sp. ESL0763]